MPRISTFLSFKRSTLSAKWRSQGVNEKNAFRLEAGGQDGILGQVTIGAMICHPLRHVRRGEKRGDGGEHRNRVGWRRCIGRRSSLAPECAGGVHSPLRHSPAFSTLANPSPSAPFPPAPFLLLLPAVLGAPSAVSPAASSVRCLSSTACATVLPSPAL